MRERKTHRLTGICATLLACLIGAFALVAPATSARAAIASSDAQARVVVYDEGPSRPAGEEGDENRSVRSLGWLPSTETTAAVADLTLTRGDALIANEVASLACSTAAIEATDCPIDSQFNDYAPGWYSQKGTWYVGSSYLYTNGISDTSSSASYVADFTNFEYQARLWRGGCDTCANRILFRGDPTPLSTDGAWYSYYSFQYTLNGDYSIFKRTSGGTSTALKSWTSSSAINKGDAWNVLRVLAEGSSLKFYINGTLVWSGVDSSLGHGRVGLGMYRDETSTGNQLRVDWATLCTRPIEVFLPRAMRSP